jgi:leader peptidase (prepilin peptidase) / N-methyltransferase
MFLYIAIIVFIFGTIIGSFLNVLVFRYNNRLFQKPRSECFSCGHQLAFFDLIPVVSFISLGGRCRYCKSRISYQYPLVEILTGIIFLILFLDMEIVNVELFFYFAVWSLFIAILVYDLKHKIIPELLVYLLIFLSLSKIIFFISANDLFSDPFLHYALLSGPIVASPLALLWFFSRGRWMGFGDVKLTLAIGWLLGVVDGFSALILSFWAGAIIGIGLILFSKLNLLLSQKFKNLTIKSEIPFAPFLILGTALVSFLGINIFDILWY